MVELNENWPASVHHDGSPVYIVAQDELKIGQTVRLRLRVGANAPVEKVFLRTCPDGEQIMNPLRPVESGPECCWWEIELKLTAHRTNYRFHLITPRGNWWYSAAGITRYSPTDQTDFKLLANYQAPEWVRQSVFYQIFPDRFWDGDPASNVKSGEYERRGIPAVARQWGQLPQNRGVGGNLEFFGGDLQGITQRLDYLADLGVTALYLTPIFTSPSNHKYDVADYRQVDKHFGGNGALAELRQATARRGMKLMLDIVPNHCGVSHPWFEAALDNPHSESAEFFTFHQYPAEYECWMGVRSLPKLNYRSQKLREEMYEGPQAIMREWMRPPYAIDGWRVDVANMLGRQGENQLGHKVGRGMRRAIKEENAEAYLLGEHFHDGTLHLQGDELDASMNYRGFTMPLIHWLAGHDINYINGSAWGDGTPLPTEALAAQWQTFQAALPWQISLQQFNQLSSHDIPRIATVLEGNQTKLTIAAGLLFTYPGVPCIYYGDEVGLPGGADPDNRRCMPWEPQEWNGELRHLYQELIRLRCESAALQQGGFQWLYTAGQTLAFQREAPSERLIIVARRAPDDLTALPVQAAALPDGATLTELLTGVKATVQAGQLPLEGLGQAGLQIWQNKH